MHNRSRSIAGTRLTPRQLRFIASVDALFLAAPLSLVAQTNGSISGTVTDQSKVAAVGAQITVTGTSLSALAGLDGRYRITSVAPGTYVLSVKRLGQKAPATISTTTLDNARRILDGSRRSPLIRHSHTS